jgi:molybdopterin synthase sulfur carrier subunit
LAKVFIPTLLRPATDGRAELEIEGATVRQIIENLDALYPGLKDRLLRPNVSIAVDGEIIPHPLAEPVSPTSEVHFLTAIRGGRPDRASEANPLNSCKQL